MFKVGKVGPRGVVCLLAALVLGSAGDVSRAADPLTDPVTKPAAADAVVDARQMRELLERAARGQSFEVDHRARRANKEAVDEVVRALRNPRWRSAAFRAIPHLPPGYDLTEDLRPLLTEDGGRWRIDAIYAITSRRGGPDAVALLAPLLGGHDADRIRAAVRQIGRCGCKEAADVLVAFFRHDDTQGRWYREMREEILTALATLGDPGTLPFAYDLLSHGEDRVSCGAIALVARAGRGTPEAAGAKLLDYAGKDHPATRDPALVEAFGRLRYHPAVPYIKRVHRERKTDDFTAAWVLAALGSPDGVDTLMDIYIRSRPLNELGCVVGEPVVPCLDGLKVISGKDFGDHRESWRRWYAEFVHRRAIVGQ